MPVMESDKLRRVSPRDYGVRFILGAAISVGAGLLGKAVGARFGGVFLAFPAILPASLTLIEEKEGRRRADRNAIGAILGGLALTAFAATGEVVLRSVEPFLGLLLCLVAWLAASFALYALLAWFQPELCDRGCD
jgi:hypothetical protein